MIRICSEAQMDRASENFSAAGGIARTRVQGGLYIMIGPGCFNPIAACSCSIAPGSYGLPPAFMSRPAAQYSAKSERGQRKGVAASVAERTISARPHLTPG